MARRIRCCDLESVGGVRGGSPTTLNLGSAQSSDTVTGLTANTTYGFEVAAANAAGQGPFSACVLVQTQPYNQKVVVAPVLTVAATGQTTAVASWSAPQNATPCAYELKWGTTYGTYGSNSGSLSSSTLHVAVTGLSANTTYYFLRMRLPDTHSHRNPSATPMG